MKKFFCLSIFVLGLLLTVDAQTLNYQLDNVSTTDTWNYKMRDANGNVLNAIAIAPGGTFTGTFTNFALPIEWAARDSNGCGTSGTITAPGGPVYPTYLCTSPSAMKYQLTQPGLANYFLEFVFD